MYKNTWCTVDDVMSDLQMPRGGGGGRGGGSGRGGRGRPAIRGRIDENFIVFGDEPPPTQLETEDTDEEYVRYGSNIDLPSPDLNLIKQMLDIVNEKNTVSTDKMDEPTDVLVITKLNGSSSEFTTPKVEVTKKKQCRNVALQSLLLLLEENKISSNSIESKKLLTPMDIVNTSTSSAVSSDQGTKPVDEIVTSDHSAVPKQVILNPVRMFRRKIRNHTPEKVNNLESVTSSPTSSGSSDYVPSAYAKELYDIFVERNNQKAKQVTLNNNLEEVYSVMKQMDALSIEPDINKHPGLSEDEFKRLGPVLLHAHRHQLQEDCKVCVIKAEIESKNNLKNTSNSLQD